MQVGPSAPHSCILPRIMHTFVPKFLRAKQGCALYMGIMITYHGYNNGHNNPMYNVYKNGGVHYTRQNMVNLR